ncbi:MAG: hypothetical protein OXG30_10965 [bacterium]|nr:hypothetical protein [bacterium]
MTDDFRRVVTAVDGEGHSVVDSDGPPPVVISPRHLDQFLTAIWAVDELPTSYTAPGDRDGFRLSPAAGGVNIIRNKLPPDSMVYVDADEALVMEGRIPEGLFTNVVIWNELGQTADYLERTVSLNDAQMEMGEDRRYRVVIAHRDPGVPNWLDTCGEPRAAVFWRFMLPAEPPDAPVCAVVPVDRVA